MHCLKCQNNVNCNEMHYGLHKQCFLDWFEQSNIIEFSNLQRKSNSSSYLELQNSSFFHGKFKKYSAALNDDSYILKMRQDEVPELPEVEYLCNHIAMALDIPVADFYYINFNGEKCFVTKNFITKHTPTDLQHIYHYRKDNQHSCIGILNAIKEKTNSLRDVSIFIKTLLFEPLIGNHDRHGRNLAFIVSANKTILSPIYDNVSYLGLESGSMLKADFNPCGKISTSTTNKPSMKDYVLELLKLGYKDEIVKYYKLIQLPSLNA